MNPVVVCALAVVGLVEFVLRIIFIMLMVASLMGILLFIMMEEVPIEPSCWSIITRELKTGKDGLNRKQRQELAYLRERERLIGNIKRLESEIL